MRLLFLKSCSFLCISMVTLVILVCLIENRHHDQFTKSTKSLPTNSLPKCGNENNMLEKGSRNSERKIIRRYMREQRKVKNILNWSFFANKHVAKNRHKTYDNNILKQPCTKHTTNQHCLDYTFQRILSPKEICGENVTLLILITSTERNFVRRNLIRQTWCSSVGTNQSSGVRCLFLFGKTNSSDFQKVLEKEAAIHGDILQDDFIEDYRNMTIKTIMAFHWFHQYCDSAQFLMKADDDVFIHTPAILSIIEHSDDYLQNAIFGPCFDDGMRVNRNRTHKWYVSKSQYNGSHFMPYCVGTGYILGASIAHKVASQMPSIPVLPIEDAYVGLYVNMLNGSVEDIPGFGIRFTNLLQYTTLYTLYSWLRTGTVFTIHKAPDELLGRFWNLAMEFKRNTNEKH